MRFSFITLSYALLAGYVSADLSTLGERIARRAGRSSNPMQRLDSLHKRNDTNVFYNANWSGAVITSPPAGETFNSVSATFVVPVPKIPPGGISHGTYNAAAWVGIDGWRHGDPILQTGVTLTIDNGKLRYDAWYEWLPDQSYSFSIPISHGDIIRATVASTSNQSGVAVIENVTTGESVFKYLNSSRALGGKSAEWIVEDFSISTNGVSSLVPLANWGSVVFTGATASTGNSTLGASTASIANIMQSGQVLSSVNIDGSTVTVSYIDGSAVTNPHV